MKLEGLMQNDYQLTLAHVLDRMRGMNSGGEVITKRDDRIDRAGYGEVAERVDRLAGGLASLGIGPGDRVATFGWNTQEHLEAYMAAPCMGAVLHQLNIRLFEEQLIYVANHAEDQVVLVDASLVSVLEEVADKLETVKRFVVVGGGDAGSLPNAMGYDELLAAGDGGFDYPELDERQAAGLCYTSGTTGNPKGVLYSHRSTVLQALGSCVADGAGIGAADKVLPVVPMFHANAWATAHAAPLTGASLVMPSQFLQGEPLARLIESERVTVAAGVPTIWMDLLRYADESEVDLSSLRTVLCGGSAVPRSLMEAFEERHGVRVLQAWGMTETSPVATFARPPEGVEGEEMWSYRASQGRALPLVDVRIVGDEGEALPWDGETTGELQARGPWVARAYYEDDSSAEKFDGGWLRTGDIASIDEQGYVRITDRTKDVIKSGGEWISSVELENEIMAHPSVLEAAVIARPDERWSERPLACVVLDEGAEVDADELRSHLQSRVAKWWLPETFAFIEEVPKTSVGKFDKKVLRRRLEEGELETAEPTAEKA